MSDRTYSLRNWIFFCRTRIDRSPDLLWTLKNVLGTLVLAHPAAALLFLTLSQQEFVGHALAPLLLLCAEVCFLSFAILVIVVSDLVQKKNKGISVWQRDAIGRLLRNFFMSLLLGISVLFIYFNLEPGFKFSSSILELLIPAGLAALIGVVKVLMVRTEQGWFWLWLFICSLVQIWLLVLKHDGKAELPWSLILVPVDLVAVDAVFLVCSAQKQVWWRRGTQVLATVLFLITWIAAGLYADAGLVSVSLVLAVAWTCMALVVVSTTEVCGAYILDIIWGHVETDFFYYKYPVLLTRQHTI